MVKTLWILSSRCRPRVDVEMSTLQVSDSGLGEGDEGGTGPGLGVGDLQCRPRVDEGEANLLQVVDPGILLLEVGKGLLVDTFRLLASWMLTLTTLSSDCCSWPVLARTLDQRHLEVIVMVDKSVGFKPFGRSLLEK